MEDARAWRRYVAVHRNTVVRHYRVQGGELPDDRSDGMTEDQLIETIEGRPEATEDTRPIEPCAKPSSRTLDPAKEWFSVPEANQFLGVSIGAVYSRIHDRQLKVETSSKPFMIPRSELVRLAAAPKLSDVIDAVVKARGCHRDSARRHVSRVRQRGVALDEILKDSRPHAPDLPGQSPTANTTPRLIKAHRKTSS